MLNQETINAIIAAVDANFNDQIAFTHDLVAKPSLRGTLQSAQDFMAEAMARRGLSVDQWLVKPDELKQLRGYSPVMDVDTSDWSNVVGAYTPRTVKGRSLIFNGHIDVVPTGNLARWTTPPFAPRLEGKWLYGRGSNDMKAGLAATLFAFDAVKKAGFLPAAPVFFESVVDEEATGIGTLACLQRGYKADCAFIPEPVGMKLMRAEVGLIWARVHVDGDPQHASGFTSTGANAIDKAIYLWSRIKPLEAEWNQRKAGIPAYADHPHPIRVNIGEFKGGEWTSSVPSLASMSIRIGVYPGIDLAEIQAEFEARIAQACAQDDYLATHPPRIEYHGHLSEGFVLDGAEGAEKTLASCHAAAVGTPLEEYAFAGATDGRFFALYQNTPAIVYGPEGDGAHGLDERVDLDTVKQVTKTMALFMAEWCGLERA